ncbi:MAG: hypothetical protein BWY62_00590 [Firmicutes bacterium ADurb.Bin356]|nr:MAG: hypothetical protein BWY62_00590 [Firmicutes bacterium ADurb.Bin356]
MLDSLSRSESVCKTKDEYSGVHNSAAAEGVGALRSETKSAIVKSVSCPTALITGILLSKIALATSGSLKAHKSSMLPPPRPTIKTEALLISFIFFIPSAILFAAKSP